MCIKHNIDEDNGNSDSDGKNKRVSMKRVFNKFEQIVRDET